MGLDAYINYVPKQSLDKLDATVDFIILTPNELEESIINEVGYWRKEYKLHECMERLYRDKGGSSNAFNCVPVRLDDNDFKNLRSQVNNLFDSQSAREHFLDVLTTSEQHHNDGRVVFYDSWW